MSLRFILGRAGSGKTTNCLNSIRKNLIEKEDGNNLILLVPEQATFQMEHELAKTPDLEGIMRAQVLSFHRLTWRVLQEVGGGSKVHLDDLGKTMIIRRFIENKKEEFKVFRRAASLPGFAESVAGAISELKLYQVSVKNIKDLLEEKGDEQSLLFDKLWDLSLLYEELEDYLKDTFIDPDDYLNLLADKVHLSPTVKDAEIWIDDFTGFTPQEIKVIENLLRTAKRVNVTLTLDPAKLNMEYDLFKSTEETYNTILALAKKTNTPVEESLVLDNLFRFQDSRSLNFLEKSFFEMGDAPYEDHEYQVRVISAQNHRAEVEWVARQIRSLSSEKGYRYKEIGVLLRDFNNYDLLLETILADNHIPYFMDRKRTIMHHPLVELIRSALEVVSEDWNYESVFRYLKTDLANVARAEADLLENYVLAFGIRGKTWYGGKIWAYRKRHQLLGDEELREKEQEQLEIINNIRADATKELQGFQNKVKESKSTREFVEALYGLLEELQIPLKLEEWSVEAENSGRLEVGREHSQIWDRVIDLFDQLIETLGEEEITLEDVIKVIDSGLESLNLGLIPPGLDQVVVGSLGRSRISELKAVFVIGVGDGILPARPINEGLFDDIERNFLKEMGIELALGSREKIFDEQYLVYNALTRAREQLVLSYPLADAEGKGLRPSMVIKRVKELLPQLQEENIGVEPPGNDQGDLDFISHPNKTLGYLGMKLRQASEGIAIPLVWWDVYQWYLKDEENQKGLERVIQGLFYNNQVLPIDPVVAKRLYGDPFKLSISRLEKFNSCPFSHFTSYGLTLKEREVYGLKIPDLGQFFHGALEAFGKKLEEDKKDWSQLDKKQCWEITNTIVEELAPQLQSEILLSTARYRYLTNKFKKTVNRAATTLVEHAKRGKFRPIALEIAFGHNEQLPALKLTLNDGTVMEIAGRIDRIDGCQKDDRYFLRVIDYKSGSTGLNMLEVFYGLKLQLITYLDIALTYAKKLVDAENILPAGILYFYLKDPLISASGPLEDEEIEKAIMKELKMQGLVLADTDVFYLQDEQTQEGWSPIIPVGIKKQDHKPIKDGEVLEEKPNPLDLFYKESKVATLEQLDGLRKYIRHLLVSGGEKILQGEAGIKPYQLKNFTPCGYCAFQAVCQFDIKNQGNEYKELKPLKQEEIWKEIMK